MVDVPVDRLEVLLVDVGHRHRNDGRLGVLLVGDRRVLDLLAPLRPFDDLFVRLDHPEGGVFLVPVVELRVTHDPVGVDRHLELPGVVERVGIERRELVAALRVRIRRQELFVQLGAGRVQLLALVQLLEVLLVLLPLRLAGLRRRVHVGGRGQQGVLGELARDRERFRVVAVVLVPVASLGVLASERLALLGGRHQVAVLLVGVDDAVLDARRVEVIRPLRQQRLVHGDGVLVSGLIEVDVAEPLEHLADVRLLLAALVEVHRPLQAGDGVGQRVAVPIRFAEADTQVLDRFRPQVGADLLSGGGARVGVLDQIVELAHRLGEAVVAVIRPRQLVQRPIVIGRILERQHLAERGDREPQLVRVVEVELADAGPRLGNELRLLPNRRAVLVELLVAAGCAGPARRRLGRRDRRIERLEAVRADEREQRLLGLLVFAHLAQAEAQQVIGRIEEAVARELGEQAAILVDGRRVIHARRRRVGRVRRVEGLLVGLVGIQVFLSRFFVVQLGEAKHRVRRPALVVRIPEQERLEHRDRVTAAVARLTIVQVDLRIVFGLYRLGLVVELALQDVARGRTVFRHHLREALDVLLHLVQQARIGWTRRDGRRRRRGRRRGGRGQHPRPHHGQRPEQQSARRTNHLSSSSTLRKSSSSALSSRFFWLVSRVTALVF